MKKIYSFMMIAALAASFAVSCKEAEPEEPKKEPVLTVKTGAADVDETDVVLNGSYTYDGTETVSVGFRYAADKSALASAQLIPATATDGKFSTELKSLANGEYWYQAVAKAGALEQAGTEGFFKVDFSLVPTVTTGVADITDKGYVLAGSYTFSSKKVEIKVGFFYAATEAALASAKFEQVTPEDGSFTFTVPSSFGASCFFQAAAIVDGKTYKGEVKSAGMTDLSAAGVANCYVVKETGWCYFSTKRVDGTVMSGDKVDWIWATEDGLISNIGYKDGGVSFKVEKYAQGNVVLAMFKGSEIVWSWNIWLSDVKDQTLNGVTFQDRNLGATGVSADEPASIGLMYQFGRKDPFIGTKIMDKSIATNLYESVAFSLDETLERQWCAPYVVNMNAGVAGFAHVTEEMSVEQSIANPMTHYGVYAKGGYGKPNDEIKDYWGGVSGSKTINDPCPAGYKVAAFTDYTKFINEFLLVSSNGVTSRYGVTADGKQTWGRVYTYNGEEYNWPATGWRAWSGVIGRPGNCIGMNTCNLMDGTNGSSVRDRSMQIYWNWGATPGGNYNCEAFPLRCVKMK